jgi:hypothetical protein
MIRRVLDTLPSTGKFVLNGLDRPFGDHSGARKRLPQQSRHGRFMIFAAVSYVDCSGSGLLLIL